MKLYKQDHFWYFDFKKDTFLLDFQRTPSAKIFEDPNNSCFKIIFDRVFIKTLKEKYEKI